MGGFLGLYFAMAAIWAVLWGMYMDTIPAFGKKRRRAARMIFLSVIWPVPGLVMIAEGVSHLFLVAIGRR
jgi:hypothetical protein